MADGYRLKDGREVAVMRIHGEKDQNVIRYGVFYRYPKLGTGWRPHPGFSLYKSNEEAWKALSEYAAEHDWTPIDTEEETDGSEV